MSARLTEEQHVMFLRLGGSKWLRARINEVINKQKEQNRAKTRDSYQTKAGTEEAKEGTRLHRSVPARRPKAAGEDA
jgi:hypothetical protein